MTDEGEQYYTDRYGRPEICRLCRHKIWHSGDFVYFAPLAKGDPLCTPPDHRPYLVKDIAQEIAAWL